MTKGIAVLGVLFFISFILSFGVFFLIFSGLEVVNYEQLYDVNCGNIHTSSAIDFCMKISFQDSCITYYECIKIVCNE